MNPNQNYFVWRSCENINPWGYHSWMCGTDLGDVTNYHTLFIFFDQKSNAPAHHGYHGKYF